jgi:hypothetical protein
MYKFIFVSLFVLSIFLKDQAHIGLPGSNEKFSYKNDTTLLIFLSEDYLKEIVAADLIDTIRKSPKAVFYFEKVTKNMCSSDFKVELHRFKNDSSLCGNVADHYEARIRESPINTTVAEQLPDIIGIIERCCPDGCD